MKDDLNTTAKQAGDAIIDMSTLLDKKMEKWSDLPTRAYNLSETECVGFINRESDTNGVNLTVDVLAPNDKQKSTLRLWGIESKQDANGADQSNNIQLDFMMDYEQATTLAKRSGAVTRDDIRAALHDQNTRLHRLIVSNQSSERYDFKLNELDEKDEIAKKATSALTAGLDILKKSAAVEAN